MNTVETTTYMDGTVLPSAMGGDDLMLQTGTPKQAPPLPAPAPSGIVGHLLIPAAAMTGACLAAIVVASSIERGSPWAGMNALASGIGLSNRRRPSGRFHAGTAAALGVVAGGSVALAMLEWVASSATSGKLPPGIATAVGGVLADKAVLRLGFFRAMQRTLGTPGMIAKYAAMGIASALTSPRRRVVESPAA